MYGVSLLSKLLWLFIVWNSACSAIARQFSIKYPISGSRHLRTFCEFFRRNANNQEKNEPTLLYQLQYI